MTTKKQILHAIREHCIDCSGGSKEEVCALVDDTTKLIQRFLGDFTKYCMEKGCIKISKESPKFVVTMKLERKREGNSGK